MKRSKRHEAKTNLSRLRSLRKGKNRKPRIGVAKGEFEVPESFCEPLPDYILKAFHGR